MPLDALREIGLAVPTGLLLGDAGEGAALGLAPGELVVADWSAFAGALGGVIRLPLLGR